jgi:hypothetical protein
LAEDSFLKEAEKLATHVEGNMNAVFKTAFDEAGPRIKECIVFFNFFTEVASRAEDMYLDLSDVGELLRNHVQGPLKEGVDGSVSKVKEKVRGQLDKLRSSMTDVAAKKTEKEGWWSTWRTCGARAPAARRPWA